MNNLSWLMYLADVLPNVQAFLVAFSIFSFVFGMFVATYIAHDLKGKGKAFFFGAFTTVFALLCMVTATLLPSPKTVYLIAGSEAGEMVVQTEEGQQVISDVKEILQNQIDKLKE